MDEIRKQRLKEDHQKLTKLGFKKVYSDDKSTSWYEMDIEDAKPFPKAKLIYENDDDYDDTLYVTMLINPVFDMWEETLIAEGGITPNGLLPIMHLYNLLNEYGEKEFLKFMENLH